MVWTGQAGDVTDFGLVLCLEDSLRVDGLGGGLMIRLNMSEISALSCACRFSLDIRHQDTCRRIRANESK